MGAIIWKSNRIYLNDTIDLFANVTEGSCEIKRKMTEVDGMGLPAGLNVPSGRFEPITATFNFNNIDPTMIRQFIVQDGFCRFRMIGNCMGVNTLSGVLVQDIMTTTIHGFSDGIPIPPMKASEASEVEVTVNVSFISINNRSGQLFMLDIMNGLMFPKNVLG